MNANEFVISIEHVRPHTTADLSNRLGRVVFGAGGRGLVRIKVIGRV